MSSDIVIALPTPTHSLSLVDAAEKLGPLTSQVQADGCAELARGLKTIAEEIAETFGPAKKAAHAAHREICASESRYAKPVEEARRRCATLLATWTTEQERIRQAEITRLAEEARKREEEERLSRAIEAEASGNREEATAILDAPASPVAIIPPPAVAKPAGVSVRSIWRGQVTDLAALVLAVAAKRVPLDVLAVDWESLGRYARAYKGAAEWPGVTWTEEKSASVRG